MRRYLPNPFASAASVNVDAAPLPDATAHHVDAEKHSQGQAPVVGLPGDDASQSYNRNADNEGLGSGGPAMLGDGPPSPTTTRSSYLPVVPSLPRAIPSVRKYLFSSSSPAASSPSSPPDSTLAHAHSHGHGHGHGHLSLHNLAHLRRRHSANSSDSIDNSSATAGDAVSKPLSELALLVDKAIGPIDHVTDALSKRLPHDRLLAALNHSVQERNRLLTQFLRARQHDAHDAMQMISSSLRWRKSIDINTFLIDTHQNMTLPTACFPMTVISTPHACKQPVVYGLIRLLDKRKAERVPFQNALLSFLESSYFGDTYVVDEMIIILDFRDWSIRRNAPYRLVKDGIQTLQDYYPERLGRVFLLNYPTTIRAAYTAISPIIDAGAKEKIVWIPDADPSVTLRKYLSPKSIPSFLGGELEASFPSAWPDVAAEFEQAKASSSHGLFHH